MMGGNSNGSHGRSPVSTNRLGFQRSASALIDYSKSKASGGRPTLQQKIPRVSSNRSLLGRGGGISPSSSALTVAAMMGDHVEEGEGARFGPIKLGSTGKRPTDQRPGSKASDVVVVQRPTPQQIPRMSSNRSLSSHSSSSSRSSSSRSVAAMMGDDDVEEGEGAPFRPIKLSTTTGKRPTLDKRPTLERPGPTQSSSCADLNYDANVSFRIRKKPVCKDKAATAECIPSSYENLQKSVLNLLQAEAQSMDSSRDIHITRSATSSEKEEDDISYSSHDGSVSVSESESEASTDVSATKGILDWTHGESNPASTQGKYFRRQQQPQSLKSLMLGASLPDEQQHPRNNVASVFPFPAATAAANRAAVRPPTRQPTRTIDLSSPPRPSATDPQAPRDTSDQTHPKQNSNWGDEQEKTPLTQHRLSLLSSDLLDFTQFSPAPYGRGNMNSFRAKSCNNIMAQKASEPNTRSRLRGRSPLRARDLPPEPSQNADWTNQKPLTKQRMSNGKEMLSLLPIDPLAKFQTWSKSCSNLMSLVNNEASHTSTRSRLVGRSRPRASEASPTPNQNADWTEQKPLTKRRMSLGSAQLLNSCCSPAVPSKDNQNSSTVTAELPEMSNGPRRHKSLGSGDIMSLLETNPAKRSAMAATRNTASPKRQPPKPKRNVSLSSTDLRSLLDLSKFSLSNSQRALMAAVDSSPPQSDRSQSPKRRSTGTSSRNLNALGNLGGGRPKRPQLSRDYGGAQRSQSSRNLMSTGGAGAPQSQGNRNALATLRAQRSQSSRNLMSTGGGGPQRPQLSRGLGGAERSQSSRNLMSTGGGPQRPQLSRGLGGAERSQSSRSLVRGAGAPQSQSNRNSLATLRAQRSQSSRNEHSPDSRSQSLRSVTCTDGDSVASAARRGGVRRRGSVRNLGAGTEGMTRSNSRRNLMGDGFGGRTNDASSFVTGSRIRRLSVASLQTT